MIHHLAISDLQSALAPAGEQAARTAHLWWIYFWVLMTVFALVAIVLFFAILRSSRAGDNSAEALALVPEEPRRERHISGTVATLVGLTTLILCTLLLYDAVAGARMNALANDPNPISIKLTGHQWWWQVEYSNESEPSKNLITANEIHVPIGKAVKLQLQSDDVIHSFWVPNLSGKKDLIPGHPTQTWLKADHAGTFTGQCAEFCGHQHAHMRLTFVTEPEEKFDQWLTSQLADAPPPSSLSTQRGQQVFVSSQCVMCHAINGTDARATVGPDLTHIASRPTLAAGSIPNTRAHLAEWIANPQNIKPAVRMPPNEFSSEDFNALLDYLGSLK